jgi:hypothetical protein
MIENVLKMVKAPTNSEMNAKTSSAVEKKPSAWLTELVLSVTTVCPVTTSTPGGRTLAMACWTAGLSAPGAVTTLMSSSLPVSWAMAWAVGRVNAARVAPARLFAVPKSAMPLMVKVCVGPAVRMRTCCPTEKSYFCAVPASITTSAEVVGGPPAIRCRLESCGYGSKLTPRVGAPPVWMALPLRPMYWA